MRIDFIADAACVWSFITWRQLRAAMRDFAADFDIAVFFPRAQSAVPRSKLNPADRARMLNALSIYACEHAVGYTRRSSTQSLSLQLSKIFRVWMQTASRTAAVLSTGPGTTLSAISKPPGIRLKLASL